MYNAMGKLQFIHCKIRFLLFLSVNDIYVSENHATSATKKITHLRTYIKWSPEESKQADFYERLKDTLVRQSETYRYHKVIP